MAPFVLYNTVHKYYLSGRKLINVFSLMFEKCWRQSLVLPFIDGVGAFCCIMVRRGSSFVCARVINAYKKNQRHAPLTLDRVDTGHLTLYARVIVTRLGWGYDKMVDIVSSLGCDTRVEMCGIVGGLLQLDCP